MLKINGKYNEALVYADIIDDGTIEQIKEILDSEVSKNSQIRIMPDCHAGASCVIGTTMTLTDKIIPNVVGVDIGCGVICINLGKIGVDLSKFDAICHEIPSGKNCGKLEENDFNLNLKKIEKLKCFKKLKEINYLVNSLGSLGGGNHFIELDKDEDDNVYLLIHTGSRNLGYQVANIYQDLAAYKVINDDYQANRLKVIKEYKETNRQKEIQDTLNKMAKEHLAYLETINRDSSYLENEDLLDYLHDLGICQEFANNNRIMLAKKILESYFETEVKVTDTSFIINEMNMQYFTSIHNYIDLKDKIVRKGAIRAYKNELLLIPINMRDGVIIGYGKSNKEYNYSAPHGAGRIMSRAEARRKLNLEDYKNTMSNIYSTTVNLDTIDEAPFAYKSIDSIINNIKDTVDIIKIIKPIYNFKASE